MATKQASKTAAKKTSTKSSQRAAAAKKSPASMPDKGRDPKGGLTKAGREFFAKRDGSHLKPGVTGKADTPEKMMRKGSFLVRTFTHPRGPMVDPKGEPSRLALSAHAWGEKVPKSISEAHTLAAKGHTLLAKYHAEQEKAGKSGSRSTKATAPVKTKTSATKTAKKTASKATGNTAPKKQSR